MVNNDTKAYSSKYTKTLIELMLFETNLHSTIKTIASASTVLIDAPRPPSNRIDTRFTAKSINAPQYTALV